MATKYYKLQAFKVNGDKLNKISVDKGKGSTFNPRTKYSSKEENLVKHMNTYMRNSGADVVGITNIITGKMTKSRWK